jgi:predicted transposase/invertase (TIGR01784 family)
MQLVKVPQFIERILFYSARTVSELLNSGETYLQLKNRRSISVIITDFSMTDSDDYHNLYQFRHSKTNNLLSNFIEVHFIELSKLPKAYDGSDLFYWCQYFTSETKEDLMKVANKVPEIDVAIEKVARLSASQEAHYQQELADKARRDYLTLMEDATIKGKAEGIAEGEARGEARGEAKKTRDLAIKFLKQNMPVGEISKLLDLPISEIEKLKN